MKIKIEGTSVQFVLKESVVFGANSFSSVDIIEERIINGRTGELREQTQYNTCALTQIPIGAKKVTIANTSYPEVDGYATFALYDSLGTFLVAGSDGTNHEILLSNYPTATQFRLSWGRATSNGTATFSFFLE